MLSVESESTVDKDANREELEIVEIMRVSKLGISCLRGSTGENAVKKYLT